MSMSCDFKELAGLNVRIDDVVYAPQLEAPEDRPFPFIYFITIENQSEETVTIKGRKWVLTDSDGWRTVVEGDGVVGKFPRLEPGQSFSYNSYFVVASDSVAEGAYFAITDDYRPFYTRIPSFQVNLPGPDDMGRSP